MTEQETRNAIIFNTIHKQTAKSISEAILHTPDLTIADLNFIIEAVKTARDILSKTTLRELAINDRVTWTSSKSGLTGFGTIKKISRTTVTVLSDEDGKLWRIPGSMLKAV
jgi:hypothetical protein